VGAALAVVVVLPLAAWAWGFTVDDALISVRYARHLASGVGYRFNEGGPMTDGVTPLPWAFVLAPLARADAITVLMRAKCVGLGAWLGAAGALGAAIARARAAASVKLLAAGTLALCAPVAAHAVSGMETGVAMALATCAAIAAHAGSAAVLAGLAASLRPELAAWALALAAVRAMEVARPRRAFVVVAALAPFSACALARVIVFGRAAPLAVLAKPSDLTHGAAYAAYALVVTLAPLALAAPLALRRAGGRAMAIAVAGAVHVAALVAVGGDWMPHARLMAPIVPSLVYAFVVVSPYARAWSNVARGGVAMAVGAALLVLGPRSWRDVGADRARLVTIARSELAGARRVAALDVGWVSAATEAPIVDLAGVTDPTIAVLAGGHTSKHVDATMLLDRDVDTLLLYAPAPVDLDAWTSARYSRVVEARLARSNLLAERFDARAWLALGASGAGYVVLRRRERIAE
jgi:hypothetical protein